MIDVVIRIRLTTAAYPLDNNHYVLQVDIEVNGEPVDIHMKLGDSGEAFFVEEIAEDDAATVPDNLATSPIPTSQFLYEEEDDEERQQLPIRRYG